MHWRRKWQPTPAFLPGESHGWKSLVGCSPWGHWESDTTEQLHFHFSLSCVGEGNGNPLQCSCLENPRDGGAWWAAGDRERLATATYRLEALAVGVQLPMAVGNNLTERIDAQVPDAWSVETEAVSEGCPKA